ncbi:MAG: TraB/VirB10 family protein [Deltaproteobacteria bacterium]|nr:TraB/VirB10 family protein [Deltaproteobacteria bacterium]
MNQKIEDIKLILKNDRRIWAVAGLIVAVIIIWELTAKPPRPRPVQVARNTAGVSTDERTAYNDLTRAFREDLDGLKRSSKENTNIIRRIQQDLKESKTRNASIFNAITERLEELGSATVRLEEQQAGRSALTLEERNARDAKGGADGTSAAGAIVQDSLEAIGFAEATVPPPPPVPQKLRTTVVSAGDAVQLKLLTGVIAPVDGTPYPVVFKLTSGVSGPDGSLLDLGEARIIAAAQGSEADGRVLFRLTNMALRHSDGRRSVVPVDGWIVGEDGIRGMKGKLIDKLGRLIVATAGTSFALAMGERISGQSNSIRIDGDDNIDVNADDINVSTASAFTDASNRLGQILLDRYEKLVPAVEVLPNREVVAIFSKSVEIELIDEQYGEGIYAASLD